MPLLIARSSAYLLLCAVIACAGESGVTAAPGTSSSTPLTVANGNSSFATVVGAELQYDAAKSGATFSGASSNALTYTVSFSPSADGLKATGSIISGAPTDPGIVTATITATDTQGHLAIDHFAIVVFDRGLPTPTLPATPYQYADAEVPLPAHFLLGAGAAGSSVASMDNTPATNRITDAGATLGRVLFYDPRLSIFDATSCASCHRPSLGFADALPLSVGFGGAVTARHAPGLANARFYKRGHFFWDERAPSLEAQVLEPIQNHDEMGMSLDALALKLSLTPYYPALFTAAFGSATVSSDRVAAALAQYLRSLVSTGSRYDRAFAANGTPNFAATLTAQEQLGEQLFRTKGCAGCHVGVAQIGDDVHNTGLDATVTDTGAGGGKFKTPSLRNVAVRTRFMHDGRFGSLDEVIQFYDFGVQPNPRLDPRLRAPDGSPQRLRLSDVEHDALVAFLGTLTDSSFLTADRFSNPFAPPGQAAPAGASVAIRGSTFIPSTLVVERGAVVSFTNYDIDRHSATFDDPAIASTPVFSVGTKTVPMPMNRGTYKYHCSVHGLRMSGAIIVAGP